MQNIVIDMCAKFHNDWLRNDRALVHWKSDNNPKKNDKNNVGSNDFGWKKYIDYNLFY